MPDPGELYASDKPWEFGRSVWAYDTCLVDDGGTCDFRLYFTQYRSPDDVLRIAIVDALLYDGEVIPEAVRGYDFLTDARQRDAHE